MAIESSGFIRFLRVPKKTAFSVWISRPLDCSSINMYIYRVVRKYVQLHLQGGAKIRQVSVFLISSVFHGDKYVCVSCYEVEYRMSKQKLDFVR